MCAFGAEDCGTRIWEKKYGRNANHKKREREAEEISRKQRRQSASRRSAGTSQENQQRDSGWGPRAQVTSTTRPVRATQEPVKDKPLHPSWEAKKRLKERQQVGIVASQGTKIKF